MILDPFTLELDGAQMAGWETGDGLPVVFLHAGVADSRMWTAQLEAVAGAGWHALAYDRRGFGDTAAQDVPFDPLEDLEAVLDALDLHAAVLVGSSNGGGLALEWALRHPGRVLGLVLLGTAVSGAPWNSTASERQVEMAEEDAAERGDLSMLNKVQAHQWLDGPRSASGRVAGAARDLFLQMNGLALGKPALTQAPARPPIWARVGEIGTPTLLIVGELDFLSQIDIHDHLSEEMPNAFATVLEGVAHLPTLERPDLVNALLVQFLHAIGGDNGDDDNEDGDEQD